MTEGKFPVKGTLTEAFVAQTGNVSDKWEQYLPIYDFVLANIRGSGQPIRLLEIGVQNGGSLDVWSQVLPAGSTVLGLDIDEACRSLIVPGNVTVKICDAADAAALDGALEGLTFDVIVDDGSHVSDDIVATFRNCFDRLKPGGFYVVEDLHASYRASHGGGFRKQGAAIEYFKTLVDAVNSDHLEPDAVERLGASETEVLRSLGRHIGSIAFFDSLCFVQKLEHPKDQPYRRVFTGRRTPVFDIASSLSLLPVAQLRNLLLCDSAFANFAPRLLRELADTSESLGRARAELATSSESLGCANAELAHSSELLGRTNAELAQMASRMQDVGDKLRSAEDRATANEAVLADIRDSTVWRISRGLARLAGIVPVSVRSRLKRVVRLFR